MIYKVIFDNENSKAKSNFVYAECSTELDFFDLEDCNIDKTKLSLLHFDIGNKKIPDLIFNDLNLRLISNRFKEVLENKIKPNFILYFEVVLKSPEGERHLCWLMLFTDIYESNIVDWNKSLVSSDQLISPVFKENLIDRGFFNFKDQFSDIYITEEVMLLLKEENLSGLDFRKCNENN